MAGIVAPAPSPLERRMRNGAFVVLLLLFLVLPHIPVSNDAHSAHGTEERVVYNNTLSSLNEHVGKAPEWYQRAKLGIFIHYGLYSVPAWAPPEGMFGHVPAGSWFAKNPYAEWYANTMKIDGSPTQEHHKKVYGEDFAYLDFVPMFNQRVKAWDPNEWADLFASVGARYVVLTTKHHDGFTLWPADTPNPHRPAAQSHCERDVVGELTAAVRARDMAMGLYYSGGIDWSFDDRVVLTDFYKPNTREYTDYAIAHYKELIHRYKPDILWNDIDFPKNGDYLSVFSEFYNTVPHGMINDRFWPHYDQVRPPLWDVVTPEYTTMSQKMGFSWETCRGIGLSFGANQVETAEHMLSVRELVRMLVDIVSKNGNLLLDVGPLADGSISALQLERLHGLGAWMDVHAAAIHDTTPWATSSGVCRSVDGQARGGTLRFTMNVARGQLFVSVLLEAEAGEDGLVEGGVFMMSPLVPTHADTTMRLLGPTPTSFTDLTWERADNAYVRVWLPAKLPDVPVHVVVVEPIPRAFLSPEEVAAQQAKVEHASPTIEMDTE